MAAALFGQQLTAQVVSRGDSTGSVDRLRVADADSLRVGRAAGGAIRLDGRLDEPEWRLADSIVTFRQREPAEGSPATEATVVRVVEAPDGLYIGVEALDREPARIRATQLRRDADLTVDDNVTLMIDSFRDQRGAFVFRTNPNGARWDEQLTGFEDANSDWNGIWSVGVSRGTDGWTAEFFIPFRTLRFHEGETAFGFNVERFIRRKNERTLWRSWGRTQGLLLLLNEGRLIGLGPLGRNRQLDVRPYALGRATTPEYDVAGTRLTDGSASVKAGGDAKITVLPTLVADLTVNTDFAQVEADQDIINLTRFPTFFPEKREFFLESSGLFDFGTPGRAQLFYSRRIGLRDGVPIPILGGARLYGKLGPWAIGALDARTGRGEEANDVVLRVKHDLFARSYIGAMALQRSAPGAAGAERAAGLDVQLPLILHGQNIEPSFWIAGTNVAGVAGTPMAWRLATDYPNDLFDNFVSLYHIDAGFDPTLGFVRRTGIRETTGHINFMPRPHAFGIRQLDLELVPAWDIVAGESGSLFRSADWQSAEFELRPLGGDLVNGGRFEVDIQRFLDAPADSFAIFRDVTIAPGRYWWTRAALEYETSRGRPFSVASVLSFGRFYDGTNTAIELDGTWRPGGRLSLGTAVSANHVSISAGSFTAVEATLRMEYAFSTRSTFQAFIQTNNEDERVDFNLRFHWIPKVGDDVYVVWNSGYSTDPAARYRFPTYGTLSHSLGGAMVIKAVHRLVR